jgi:hypothetical protein
MLTFFNAIDIRFQPALLITAGGITTSAQRFFPFS